MSANLENSAVATRWKKVSFHSNFKEGQCQTMFRLPYNCSHFTIARQSSKSFKLGFHSTWTKNFHMYKMDLEKAEEPQIKSPTSTGSQKKQENSRKNIYFWLLTTLRSLTVWITTNCGKFLKRWEYSTTLPVSWETYMQVKKQELEPDMEKWTGSKLRQEHVKLHMVTLLI